MRKPLRSRRRTAGAPSSQDLLEKVLASLGDALVLVDRTERITLFNVAAQELTGVSESVALRQTCEELFARTPSIPAMVRRALRLGQAQACHEEQLSLPARTVPIRFSCSPVWAGAAREPEGVALVIQDLTYLRRLEEEVRRNETLARLGGLVAGLAHEIRNPLGGIRGAAQLLARRCAGQPEVGTYTSLMIREIDRLGRFVDDLLVFGTPPDPGSMPVNIPKVLRDVVTLLGPELAERQVTVRLRVDPSIPDVPGDEGQLTHLFLNLLKNSVEAMRGPGSITVTTRMETDFHILRHPGTGPQPQGSRGTARFQRVEVADTGPGFTPADLPRVFEPFFTRKPHGTGLGLAICERIVASHGGSIRAANRHEGGAIVTVLLPVQPT